MPLTLPNASQYQGARGTRAQGSVSSREVVVLKSTSSTERQPAARGRLGGRTLAPPKGSEPLRFYSLGDLTQPAQQVAHASRIPLGDLTQSAQQVAHARACHCLSNRIPLSAGWRLQAIFR